MRNIIILLALSYLSGSVLYANIFGALFGVKERYAESADKNPGVTNAYVYGGFWCGTLTLICELLKGALPVYMALRMEPALSRQILPFILTAPVVGHILPVFSRFHGGKGIAVTFGVLVGLFPYAKPLLVFAAVFIFLSVVVRISPHYYRTIAAYVLTAAVMPLARVRGWICFSFLLLAGLVCVRMFLSHEEKERIEVKLLWMR